MANPFLIFGADFYNFILPWIFTFAVVFGLLAKSKALGDNKGVNAAVALVAAFFVALVGGPQMAAFFSSLFGGASVFLTGILVVVLFITLADVSWDKKGGTSGMMVLIVMILIGAVLFIASTGSVVGLSLSPDTVALIFWLIVIVAIIWLVAYKGDGGGGGGAPAAGGH